MFIDVFVDVFVHTKELYQNIQFFVVYSLQKEAGGVSLKSKLAVATCEVAKHFYGVARHFYGSIHVLLPSEEEPVFAF